MSDGLELLRTLVDGIDPVATDGALPPDVLRYVLEYPTMPDLDGERERIAELIGTDRFELDYLFADPEEPDADDGVFVILQLPGLERTPSRAGLFSIGYGLADALDLRSAEPDLGSDLFVDQPDQSQVAEEGAVGEALQGFCFVDDDPPADHQWALDLIKAPAAWTIAPGQGQGILVGQPDTGVAVHHELELDAVDMDIGIDIVDGDSDPTDPRTGGGNPGHGTGTGSVVVSREIHELVGSAPQATLVPIRCIEDVKVFNASPVARAIDHARTSGCHIVTMSLGGLPSWGLHTAVKRAVRDDLIVLAAAGNCVKTVVWPARFGRVIAVAGCNAAKEPWRGTCKGEAVDITAPGELVWRANWDESGNSTIGGGQGTSFAVALTAGVAALWLSHHGIDQVKTAASDQNTSVQELFRRLLRESADTPTGWDTNRMGAGIVDAERLLNTDLVDGRAVVGLESTGAATGALEERFVQGAPAGRGDESERELIDALDWRRYNLEVASTVTEDLRRGSGPGVETGSERISDELRAAAESSTSPVVRRVAARPAGIRPPGSGATPADQRAATTLRSVATGPTVGLESAKTMSNDDARDALTDDFIDAKLGNLERRMAGADSGDPRTPLSPAQASLMADARRVMTDLREGRFPASGDIDGRTALEALVALDGRPVVPLFQDTIDLTDERLGAWQTKVAFLASHLNEAMKSVGRIDVNGVHAGTGFVAGPAHVLTNRHVVETLAAAVPSHNDPDRWVLEGEATINFDPAGVDPERRFRITEVIFTGRQRIHGSPIDFNKLDMAVLRVEAGNDSGPLPEPLPISTDPTFTTQGDELFVIGYPARPVSVPLDDEGLPRLDVVERLNELFGLNYSMQYMSPGMVLDSTATLADNPRKWVFSHDATSLGGSSGSCVFTFDREFLVSGLHFAGHWLSANFAHDFAAMAGADDLPDEIRRLLFDVERS